MPAGGYFKTNYSDDLEIEAFSTSFRRFWFGVFVLCLLLAPLVLPGFWLHLMVLVMVVCIAALGLNLLTGYTGLVSLGHAGFLCSGAFTTGILGARFGIPFWAVVPMAAVVGAILGLITGLSAFRLRGLYLILGTIAMHYIIVWAATEYQFRGHYEAGIPIPFASVGPWVIDSTREWYYLMATVTAVVALFCINLVRSGVGRALMAIRDRDIAAEALGVDLGHYKLLAFMLSSAIAAIAGSLNAYYTNFVAVEAFTIWLSISYIAAIVIGGLGSVMGSFLGAGFVVLLPQIIDMSVDLLKLPASVENLTSAIQLSAFGLFIVLFLVLEPQGLTGIWLRIRSYFELFPFKYRKTPATKA